MSSHKQNPTQYSSQEIDNESFNDTYKIRETALYGYDVTSDSFKPANVDATGNLISDQTLRNLTDQLAHLVQTLSRQQGMPDSAGRLRVITDTGSSMNNLQFFGVNNTNQQFSLAPVPHQFGYMAWGVQRNKITTA